MTANSGVLSKTIYAVIGVMGFVALIDTSMISPIIAAHARELNAGEVLAGLIAGAYSIVAIPMIIISGMLSDLVGRVRLVRLGLAGDLAVMSLYAFAPTPQLLLAARILHAASDSFIVPSALALIGDLFSHGLGAPLALFWVFVALAIVLGSGLATALVSTLGFQAVYGSIGMLTAACLALTLTGRLSVLSMGGGGSRRLEGWGLISRYRLRVALSMLSVFSLYIVIGGMIGVLPTLLIDRYGFEARGAAAQIGLFMALSTAASIPLFPLAARLAREKTPLFPLALGLAATILTSLMIEFGAGSTVTRLAAALVFGVALSSIIFASSYIVVALPGGVRGFASGLNQSATLLGVAVGAPLSSLYVGLLGGWGVFMIFGTAPALVCLALSLAFRPGLAREDVA